MKQILYALLLTFSFAGTAHADLLLEPYLGYDTGKVEQGGTSEDLNGVSYGARIGFQRLGFMIGGDVKSGKWKYHSSPSLDVTPQELGVFVGYNFPVMLRVYGVYNFDSQNKYEISSGDLKYEGTGFKLGVGFTGLPFVSINLEYSNSTFDELNGRDMTNDMTSKMYGINVSLPLTF
jgi:hypothetical protein